MSEWWLAAFCGKEFLNSRQLNRQALLGYRVRYSVLVVDWEWLTPVALAAEDCVAQTVVHLHAAKFILGNILLCLCDSLLDSESVKVEFAAAELLDRRISHYTLLGIETLLTYIATLNERTHLNTKVLCKCIVAAVVCRNRHNSTSTITCKYIVAHPYRNLLACNGVDCI